MEFDNLAEHSSTNMPPLRRWFPRPCVIEYLESNRLATPGVCCKTAVRNANPRPRPRNQAVGRFAVSEATKPVALPLEYITQPSRSRRSWSGSRKFSAEKEIDLILIGHPRNMDGSYGPAAQKVENIVGVLKTAITVPIKLGPSA